MKGLFRRRWSWGLGVVALLPLLGSCGNDDSPVAPEDQLQLQGQSANFVYWGAPDDVPVNAQWQERHFEWASARLELAPTGKITYRKYRDQAHLTAVTGHSRGNGFAEPERYVFHSIWDRDSHEYIHVLFNAAVGTAPPLFSEGVAVAHHGASFSGSFDGDPLWNEESVHTIALRLHRSGQLPGVSSLAPASGFYDYDGQMTYPVAGSFVRYLIDTDGIRRFKDFVRRTDGPGDDLGETRENFAAVYGTSLAEAWERWLGFLEAGSP